jgi:hypothetical protein
MALSLTHSRPHRAHLFAPNREGGDEAFEVTAAGAPFAHFHHN